ncbi:MAG: hypothetical protein IPN32_24420 [Deltaproteobacteria bacterium]|nr:hypothetical protein [Deltaproteobacteria bacterium]
MNDDVRVLMMNSLRGAPRVDAALWQPGRAMRRSVVALALVSLVACEKRGTTVPPTTASPETSAEVLGSLDRQTDPCNDFYRFACGGWIDATPLPADQPRYGRFHVLRDRNAEAMRAILERAASKPGDKAGAFWTACMDEAAIEQAGTQPLAPLLAAIDRVDDPTSLMTAIGTLHRAGVPVLFDVGIDADYKQPTVNLAFLGQAGLGLPDREFYRSTDARMLQLREGYVAHVATMLELGGVAEPAARAADIVTFETALAEISVPREALREPEARYAQVERAALERERRCRGRPTSPRSGAMTSSRSAWRRRPTSRRCRGWSVAPRCRRCRPICAGTCCTASPTTCRAASSTPRSRSTARACAASSSSSPAGSAVSTPPTMRWVSWSDATSSPSASRPAAARSRSR